AEKYIGTLRVLAQAMLAARGPKHRRAVALDMIDRGEARYARRAFGRRVGCDHRYDRMDFRHRVAPLARDQTIFVLTMVDRDRLARLREQIHDRRAAELEMLRAEHAEP